MSHLYWFHEAHLKRIQHLFPKPRGVARVHDRRVLSGIIHVIRNGLRWREAPSDYGPHKTLYNRWTRWSHTGIFARILTELAAQGDATGTLLIDATHLKAHRTASSMRGGTIFTTTKLGPRGVAKFTRCQFREEKLTAIPTSLQAFYQCGVLCGVCPKSIHINQ